MKKFWLIILVGLLAVACSKKKGATPVVPPSGFVDSPYLYMSVNGYTFATDTVYITSVSYPNDSAKKDVQIKALKTSGNASYSLSFYITNFTGINTYAIAPPLVSATYYVNSTRHYAQSGQITVVTDSNNVITGTFNFTADSLTAINGSFNVQL